MRRAREVQTCFELPECPLQIALSQVNDGQIHIWKRTLRLEFDGTLQHTPRHIQVAKFAIRHSSKATRISGRRIEAQRLIQCCRRARAVARVPASKAEQVMR